MGGSADPTPPIRNLTDRVVEEILKPGTASPQVLLEMFKTVAQGNATSSRPATDRPGPSLSFWTAVPWAVLFTALGGLATAYLQGAFQTTQNRDSQTASYELEILKYQYSAFQYLVEVSPDDFETTERANERRARICMAIRFGIVRVPPHVLGVASINDAAYEEELNKVLATYDCDNVGLPRSFPAPPTVGRTVEAGEAAPCPAALTLPDRSLPVPPALAATDDFGSKVLRLAIEELEAGVHERSDPERVREYFGSVDLPYDGCAGVDWSAAFVSFLLAQAGNEPRLSLAAAEFDILNGGVRNAAFFRPQEGVPEAGDLIFFSFRVPVVEFFSEGGEPQFPSGRVEGAHSGVIYSVGEEGIRYISGNANNRVNWQLVSSDDPKIVGFIRL